MRETNTGPDRYVIQCNYAEGTRIAPGGARAYLVLANPGNYHDRIIIKVRSRGGRWVEKWERIERLIDFRVKVLPPTHPRYHDERLWSYEGEALRALAEELAQARRSWLAYHAERRTRGPEPPEQ
jgi:hypothetical protein